MKKLIFLFLITTSISLNAGHHKVNDFSSEEIVRMAYSTFASGDIDAWSKLHSDDLKFSIYGKLPHSGIHIGTEATIKNVFEVIPKFWPNFKLEIQNIDTVKTQTGSTVYVLHKMTADNLETLALHMFTLKNGKINSFSAFDDYDSMRKAMIK
ncbi:MAG: nuclear transport factor 2 family protein [Hyphomicrobiales bacterium]